MQACCAGDDDRGRGIPLVLTSGVHVYLGAALHHGGDLRSRRAHFHQVPAQLVLHPQRDRGRAGPRYHDARHRRSGRWSQDVGGRQRDTLGRQRHRAGDEFAVGPQRDVHRPVSTAEFGEFAGAVERVDDPDPVRAQPDRVVSTLLGEHRVTGASRRQLFHQELMRTRVTGGLALIGVRIGELGSHLQQ